MLAFNAAISGARATAAWLLLISLLLDFLDGAIARAMHEQSDFGMHLDSLVDIVVFGMVPAGIAIALLPSVWVLLSALLFVGAGAFRLARFQYRRIEGAYEGMPITVNAALFAVVLLASPAVYGWLIPVVFTLSAVLMVSWFRVRKV
jgi:CDP-diacylglycerol--serine O-phosphatidyltransferase